MSLLQRSFLRLSLQVCTAVLRLSRAADSALVPFLQVGRGALCRMDSALSAIAPYLLMPLTS